MADFLLRLHGTVQHRPSGTDDGVVEVPLERSESWSWYDPIRPALAPGRPLDWSVGPVKPIVIAQRSVPLSTPPHLISLTELDQNSPPMANLEEITEVP